MKKKTFITVLAVVLGLFSAQTVSAGWVSDTLKKIENGEISPGVIRPADPTNTPTPAPVEEETASSSKFSFSFCVDSNEDIAEVEPAIVVNAPDGKAYAWTSSDVVNDDAIRQSPSSADRLLCSSSQLGTFSFRSIQADVATHENSAEYRRFFSPPYSYLSCVCFLGLVVLVVSGAVLNLSRTEGFFSKSC